MIFQSDCGVLSGGGRPAAVLVGGSGRSTSSDTRLNCRAARQPLCSAARRRRATIGTQLPRPTRDRRTGLVRRPPRPAAAAAVADHRSPPRRARAVLPLGQDSAVLRASPDIVSTRRTVTSRTRPCFFLPVPQHGSRSKEPLLSAVTLGPAVGIATRSGLRFYCPDTDSSVSALRTAVKAASTPGRLRVAAN